MSETPIEERLKAVRAARAELGSVREVVRTAADELAAEEQALADDKALSDAIAKHGALGKGVQIVETDLGMVIVRKPNPVLFRRYQDETREAAPSTEALEKLVGPSLVHPARARFDAMLDEQPFILTRAANAVCDLAGVRAAAVKGKF